MKVLWLKSRAFLYPTENEEKVQQAFKAIFPFSQPKKKEIKGAYGPFFCLDYETKRSRELKDFLEKLKTLKLERIEEMVDQRGCFYIRFDKQSAFSGSLKRGGKDVVWVKMKATSHPFDREKIISGLKEVIS